MYTVTALSQYFQNSEESGKQKRLNGQGMP